MTGTVESLYQCTLIAKACAHLRIYHIPFEEVQIVCDCKKDIQILVLEAVQDTNTS